MHLFLGAYNSKTLPSWWEFITLVLSSELVYETWQVSRKLKNSWWDVSQLWFSPIKKFVFTQFGVFFFFL